MIEKEERILIAGFGGQGILVAGTILSYAGIYDGLHVSALPSYGAEKRGGTANCMVKISTNPIADPMFTEATVEIIFNQPSLDKFYKKIISGGKLFYNSSLATLNGIAQNVDVYAIETENLLVEFRSKKILNIIMLTKFVKQTGILSMESMEKAIKKVFENKNKNVIDQNINIFRNVVGKNSI